MCGWMPQTVDALGSLNERLKEDALNSRIVKTDHAGVGAGLVTATDEIRAALDIPSTTMLHSATSYPLGRSACRESAKESLAA
jgi:hypothetical protein